MSFAQRKEYAGQERATTGAAFSRGRFAVDDLRRLQYLTAAQRRAFNIFAEFAAPVHVELSLDLAGGDAAGELERMRSAALVAAAAAPRRIDVSADHWYAVTTRRIDAMKRIEDAMTAELDRAVPRPMRSILDVFAAQSRRLDDVSSQLDCARAALAGRKLIERAKGLLMKSRRLSENDAYRLMRQTAMRQNRRLVDVAEAIVSMTPATR